MSDIPVGHDTGARLIITAVIRKGGLHLDVGNRHMKEIHIHPTAGIKPDLDEHLGVHPTAPTHIRGIGIEMTPDHLVSPGGLVPAPLTPQRLNGDDLHRIDHRPDPKTVDGGVSRGVAGLDISTGRDAILGLRGMRDILLAILIFLSL